MRANSGDWLEASIVSAGSDFTSAALADGMVADPTFGSLLLGGVQIPLFRL